MSERQAKDWHKMRKRGSLNAYSRPPSIAALLSQRPAYAPTLTAPRRYGHVWRDSRGNPISLHKVKWVEDYDKKYDEKGNPR